MVFNFMNTAPTVYLVLNIYLQSNMHVEADIIKTLDKYLFDDKIYILTYLKTNNNQVLQRRSPQIAIACQTSIRAGVAPIPAP